MVGLYDRAAVGVRRNGDENPYFCAVVGVGRGRGRVLTGQAGPDQAQRVAVTEFKRMTGYPQGRPGYEVDHIVPLARGVSVR